MTIAAWSLGSAPSEALHIPGSRAEAVLDELQDRFPDQAGECGCRGNPESDPQDDTKRKFREALERKKVNSAGAADSSGVSAENIGFAIPSNAILATLEKLGVDVQ